MRSFNNLYSPPNIIRIINSRRRAGHAAGTEEMINIHKPGRGEPAGRAWAWV
jgi:hypothetical protein